MHAFGAFGASSEAGLAFAMIDRARSCLLGGLAAGIAAIATLRQNQVTAPNVSVCCDVAVGTGRPVVGS